jgi:predicted acetyltransferase
MRAMPVEIATVPHDDKEVLRRLIEFYDYDFSELLGWDVNEHGTFGYRYFDQYWTDPDRHPLFIRVDGRLAGFALVRAGQPHDMAEFFVMRKYRRVGIGTEAARSIFTQFPGSWQVRQLEANVNATAFWQRAIPVAFDEGRWDEGPVQHFTID